MNNLLIHLDIQSNCNELLNIIKLIKLTLPLYLMWQYNLEPL